MAMIYKAETQKTVTLQPSGVRWPSKAVVATHSGKQITWDDAFQSDLALAPDRYAWDGNPPVRPGSDGNYPHAIPGVTGVL